MHDYDRRTARTKTAGLEPEHVALVEAFQREAKQKARRWKLPGDFTEVWVGPTPRGVSFQALRGDKTFLPFWVTYELFDSRPHIDLTSSDHDSVKLPLDTPPAKVLAKLWRMQSRILREESRGRTARTKTAAARGPIWDALKDTWNDLHDMERQLENAAHEYDVAASYRGGEGERGAQIVLMHLKTAIMGLKDLAKSGGGLDDANEAEMAFVKKFGTPEEYADAQRREMYPR